MVLTDRKGAARAVAWCVILMLLVPYVSATVSSATIPQSPDPNYEDRPEALASYKMHIAYGGEDQDVRMSGTIQYIDNISSGTGVTTLEQIHDDYLVIAASVPLMHTYAEISKAREDLRVQTQLFSEETKAQMVLFKGTNSDMRGSLRVYQNETENARSGNESPHWLANESARLTLFNKASMERFRTIRSLEKQGVNTTLIQNISGQIDAMRPVLQKVLINQSSPALKTTNAAIRTITHDFRENVASSRAALAIEMKRDAMMAM
ncbi:MAG: hypothetical protein PHT99_10435 [Methanoregula sp.]|nr:hypothetical protein [Methanoregula sp.]